MAFCMIFALIKIEHMIYFCREFILLIMILGSRNSKYPPLVTKQTILGPLISTLQVKMLQFAKGGSPAEKSSKALLESARLLANQILKGCVPLLIFQLKVGDISTLNFFCVLVSTPCQDVPVEDTEEFPPLCPLEAQTCTCTLGILALFFPKKLIQSKTNKINPLLMTHELFKTKNSFPSCLHPC